MQQVVGAFGRCAFVNRELGPDSWAVAVMEGVEKWACFPRDSFHPPSHLSPSASLSTLCHPQELGSGSKMEAELSTEPHDPDAHGSPPFVPPLPLSLQQQLWSYLFQTWGLFGTQLES